MQAPNPNICLDIFPDYFIINVLPLSTRGISGRVYYMDVRLDIQPLRQTMDHTDTSITQAISSNKSTLNYY